MFDTILHACLKRSSLLDVFDAIQSCAEGFHRVGNKLVGGRCEPCQCHNHADTCDPHTGQCHVSSYPARQSFTLTLSSVVVCDELLLVVHFCTFVKYLAV